MNPTLVRPREASRPARIAIMSLITAVWLAQALPGGSPPGLDAFRRIESTHTKLGRTICILPDMAWAYLRGKISRAYGI